MGVLCDYFVAADDEEAAGVLDVVGGPSGGGVTRPPEPAPKRGLFRRKPEPPPPPPPAVPAPAYPTVRAKGIDPVVQMGTLEELLTGRPYDDVVGDGSGDVVASRDGGEVVVARLTDALTDALAAATDERLAEVAAPWSETEEFWGQGDPGELAELLRDLAALARLARDRGHRLYCWVSV